MGTPWEPVESTARKFPEDKSAFWCTHPAAVFSPLPGTLRASHVPEGPRCAPVAYPHAASRLWGRASSSLVVVWVLPCGTVPSHRRADVRSHSASWAIVRGPRKASLLAARTDWAMRLPTPFVTRSQLTRALLSVQAQPPFRPMRVTRSCAVLARAFMQLDNALSRCCGCRESTAPACG